MRKVNAKNRCIKCEPIVIGKDGVRHGKRENCLQGRANAKESGFYLILDLRAIFAFPCVRCPLQGSPSTKRNPR